SGEDLLYYLPRPGETIEEIEAIAPVLTHVVALQGHPEAGQFLEGIEFRGLTFSHSEWCFPKGFEQGRSMPELSPRPKQEVGGFGQAAVGVPGAVWAEGARAAVFDHCTFADLGSYGLDLGRGCQSNRVIYCEFRDLGAGGLKIGETHLRALPFEQSRANLVSHCRIHDGGLLFHSAVGI